MKEYFSVGKRLPATDWPAKVRGEAEYALDLTFLKMLYGKILRSSKPHAKIIYVDTEKAKKLRGVKGIVTFKDTPGKKIPTIMQEQDPELFSDEYPLVKDKARYIGDAIAAVAAIDEETASEALDLIHVEYEELPPIFDPEEAMKPGAPLIHDDKGKNICSKMSGSLGNIEKAFNDANYIREDRFKTNLLAYASPEVINCLAIFDSISGKLTIHGSFQYLYWIRRGLSYTLDLPLYKVRVVHPYVGSYFGGKEIVYKEHFCASLLSMRTSRPVKIVNTREEDFCIRSSRHPTIVWLKTGVKSNGEIIASEVKTITDAGAYMHLAAITPAATTESLFPYRIPDRSWEGISVHTNKTPSGPNRGYGNQQIAWMSELHIELLCKDLGFDPVDFRLMNARKREEKPKFHSVVGNLKDCLNSACQRVNRKEKKENGVLHGVGVACALGGTMRGLSSIPVEAIVRVGNDGKVTLSIITDDGGAGQYQGYCRIVAEELGIPLEDIYLETGDTDITPFNLGDHMFSNTVLHGTAVLSAAKEVRRIIFEAVAKKIEVNPDDLEVRNGMVSVKGMVNKEIPFREAAKLALSEKGVIEARGEYRSDVPKGLWSGEDMLYERTYFGAAAAEVEVDRETGKVKVLKVASAYDVGFAINPMGVEGQWAFPLDFR